MDYITAAEAADAWGISRRRVQILCANGRIDGAMLVGNAWLVPRYAVKPTDGRRKKPALTDKSDVLNRVFVGDCMTHMAHIPEGTVDMVLCDLPYGMTDHAWDTPLDLSALWRQYKRVLKPNGVVVLTAAGLFAGKLMMSQSKLYKYRYVWIKSKATNHFQAARQPLRQTEDVLVFYKEQPTYNPEMGDDDRYPTDTLYFPSAVSEGKVYHPSQKPVALGRYLIRTYTQPGDVVLDNTCGSGSFLVAALLEDRSFIGIEKDESYAKAAKDRLLTALQGMSQTRSFP